MSSPALKRKAGEIATATAETITAAASSKKPKVNASITSFFAASQSSTTKVTTAGTGNETDTANDSPTTAPTSNTVTSSGSVPTSTFDRAKWAAQLSPEVRDLLALEIAHLEDGWLAALKEEIVSEGFLGLKRFLRSEKQAGKTVYPPEDEIYSW